MAQIKNEIIIIGAGFAGLTTAILLKRVGLSVSIFEASKGPNHVGGGIVLSPNGLRVLRKMGLWQNFIEAGNIMKTTSFFDGKQKIIADKIFAGTAHYGEPTLFIRRDRAHAILTKAAKDEGISIEYDKKLVSVEQDSSVIVRFEDQTFREGTCLIGADGAGSVTRKIVLSEKSTSLTFQRLVYAGGFIDGSSLISKHSLEIDQQRAFIGDKGVFAYEHIHNAKDTPRLYWGTFYGDEKRVSRDEINKLSLEDRKKLLKSVHHGYPKLVYEIIDDSSEIILAPISDLDELPSWSYKKTLLIGDAAHAVSPIIGLGVNMSFEDAHMLSELFLIHNNNSVKVFSDFEKLRKPRVTKIIETARKSTRMSQVNVGVLNYFRNIAFSFLVKAANRDKANWIYSYSVEEELKKIKPGPN